MPARIVVVHDDTRFTQALVDKYGTNMAWFPDPVAALKTLARARTVEFLISRVQFSDRQPLGLSLARVVRLSRPDVRVIFTGKEEHRLYARGLGEFIPEPVSASFIGMIIEWLTRTGEDPAASNLEA